MRAFHSQCQCRDIVLELLARVEKMYNNWEEKQVERQPFID